jgi:hypothetical protein
MSEEAAARLAYQPQLLADEITKNNKRRRRPTVASILHTRELN